MFCFQSCVQKSFKRNVKVTLDVSGKKNIDSAGIRGEENPLSWNNDFPMQELVKDSLYGAIISAETGYLFAEFKFTINGIFELENMPNRRLIFAQGDTTYYHAVFDRKD